jgi:hypothetical protein
MLQRPPLSAARRLAARATGGIGGGWGWHRLGSALHCRDRGRPEVMEPLEPAEVHSREAIGLAMMQP